MRSVSVCILCVKVWNFNEHIKNNRNLFFTVIQMSSNTSNRFAVVGVNFEMLFCELNDLIFQNYDHSGCIFEPGIKDMSVYCLLKCRLMTRRAVFAPLNQVVFYNSQVFSMSDQSIDYRQD